MFEQLTLDLPVVGALPGVTVEVMPGQKYVPIVQEKAIPPVAVVQLVPKGNGEYRLVAQILPRMFALTTENLQKLGIGLSRKSLIKLIRAKFVDGNQTMPGLHQFDYHSYLAHLDRAAVSGFWDAEHHRDLGGRIVSNRQHLARCTFEHY